MAKNVIVKTEDLKRAFEFGESKIWALNGVDMEVRKGEFVVVLGPSGAGKTLLLECIIGLRKPTKGKIFIDHRDVTNFPPERRNLAYVPQNYALFPHMSVRENIAYGLRVRGYSKAEIDAAVRELSKELGVDDLLDRKISTLSGGEQQRVALARALAIKPRLLLLDEPLSALDSETREEIREYLKEIRKSIGFTAIHVTHDFIEAADLGDRMAVMFNGEILQIGEPSEVMNRPRNKLIASFTGFKNIFKGVVTNRIGSLAEIDVKGTSIYAVTERTGEVTVAIRPESIIVTLESVKMSARNLLEGVIQEISETPPFISLKVDAGIPLTVYLTRNAVEDLNLKSGKKIYLAFKASDVMVF